MPPKKEQKKEIIRILQANKFWSYVTYPQDIVDKATVFLTTFQKQLIQLISQDKTFQENFQLLCEKIGVAVHPALQNLPKEQSKFPELKNKQYGARLVKILNFKIDAITLKLLSFLMTYYKINTLKLSRNELNLQSQHLKKLIQKQSSISTLFLQWNPLIQIGNRRDIFIGTVKPSIQHLLLRQNKLGNQICMDIIQKIKDTPTICLKSLDFTGNQLTTEMGGVFFKFVQESRYLEFLGLSKNKFDTSQFLIKLFNCIGQVSITEQQYTKYLQTIKLRDDTIQKNKKKKKGAIDEPLPFIFELRQNEQGRSLVKNTSIQNINLAKNAILDSSTTAIKNFAQSQGKNVQIFLQGNKFSKKSKDALQIYKNLLF